MAQRNSYNKIKGDFGIGEGFSPQDKQKLGNVELANGYVINVGGKAIGETTTKRATQQSIALLFSLREILRNTHIYRKDTNTGYEGESVLHGICPVQIDGKPYLARSVFKKKRQADGSLFWQIYGIKAMPLKKGEGTSSVYGQARNPPTHTIEISSLNILYDWVAAVKDDNDRFPEDRAILCQLGEKAAHRGSITFADAETVIRVLRDSANISTRRGA